jgi:hypothetical protein
MNDIYKRIYTSRKRGGSGYDCLQTFYWRSVITAKRLSIKIAKTRITKQYFTQEEVDKWLKYIKKLTDRKIEQTQEEFIIPSIKPKALDKYYRADIFLAHMVRPLYEGGINTLSLKITLNQKRKDYYRIATAVMKTIIESYQALYNQEWYRNTFNLQRPHALFWTNPYRRLYSEKETKERYLKLKKLENEGKSSADIDVPYNMFLPRQDSPKQRRKWKLFTEKQLKKILKSKIDTRMLMKIYSNARKL